MLKTKLYEKQNGQTKNITTENKEPQKNVILQGKNNPPESKHKKIKIISII